MSSWKSSPSRPSTPTKWGTARNIEVEYETDSHSESTDFSIPSAHELERTVRSTLSWWQEEYGLCFLCLACSGVLVTVLYLFNGRLEPDWNSDLQFSTVVIALMTVLRLALKGIIETCISQGAWIWVSKYRRGKTGARLEDFKIHLACIGAAALIFTHTFEAISSQMVQFDDNPTVFVDKSDTNSIPAPPPARAESWHNVIPNGYGGDLSLGLSTKAAIYDGIIASTISDLPMHCATANCTWPVFPTLAVCGNCSEMAYTTSCDSQNTCNYTMTSGTMISDPPGDGPSEYHFAVTPSNGSGAIDPEYQAVISTWDIMSVGKTPSKTTTQAYECSLWFCLKSYNITIINGITNTSVTAVWSKAEFAAESSAHFDEYVFVDIPPEINVYNQTRYHVPQDSIDTLRTFMNKLTYGTASEVESVVQYDTDWIQAMQNSTVDLSGWIERLAMSLTDDIRLSGTVDMMRNLDYTGTAYTVASFVKVNWWWTALPVTLMIVALLYLMQTVWRTARDQVCAWKSDSLPMLFCHVSKTIHAQVRNGMDVPEGLDHHVGRTEVELVRKADGQWLFREPVNEEEQPCCA
ncbi:hypothetical protein F5Y15DRAFT_412481 [Xylariaceae sp. FL0016]|nr:hypothetical protein F5Y15DRAFT_412481 [Xylariaceae sp. FL0016]